MPSYLTLILYTNVCYKNVLHITVFEFSVGSKRRQRWLPPNGNTNQ